MMVIKNWTAYLTKETSILPLVVFRITFGFLMCFSMFRFMYNGWIEDCYIKPKFHFTYQYFDWVTPFDTLTMYSIVSVCAISALSIGLGVLYRASTIVFFFTFTYLELIEKSWYLNHYYFVSLVAFLLILVPANRRYAIDSKLFPRLKLNTVPNWTTVIFKLQLCTVYVFGGLAKLKADWLLNAQPLKIWLKARTDIPLIGWLFEYDFMPFIFSWSGMLYDLIIPFLLWTKQTRPMAYVLVIIFHVLTYVLFNIGMFPWLMIFGSLIFITHQEWNKILKIFNIKQSNAIQTYSYKTKRLIIPFIFIFFSIQTILPFRHYILTDNVLWTENGFRFAWHVMVMEKNGFTEFTIVDTSSGKQWKEYPKKRLTAIQEKQMSFQPDMIWQYAQFLEKAYKGKGLKNIAIYVNSKVSLNGRMSQTFINPETNLLQLKSADEIYNHILPLVQ
ncbi:HTTM domain-containing protein [Ichthyenterobacterium magnum]|uniref:Vitamin K-dependent gamma-carboxylase-like protein n=1 Tax=Ichthyenterobacterium magnum TaxID=1230530 RepID=A0A420DMF4_9FLAO|nr:HTTM domain-containing protein [Ichthyenterobacterium magnum]RKE95423.1 vitamin K-dependent gamma-carboxylase-like protein [Ichthyenterobacterium magnum]